ncbi:MAG: archease, partial [Dehalococcoidaceae bacterium]|nr:archease [Dehalococcoidaceae bacterium]
MASGYRLTEHTADIGLIARGIDLSEAYANAARGMFSIITDLRKIRLRQSVTLCIAEQDRETLLFEWLNRLLYYFDTQGIILRNFTVVLAGPNHLTAVCRGEKYDPDRHIIKTGIKAATFHKLSIQAGT